MHQVILVGDVPGSACCGLRRLEKPFRRYSLQMTAYCISCFFLLFGKITDKKQLNEGKNYFGIKFEGAVHHGVACSRELEAVAHHACLRSMRCHTVDEPGKGLEIETHQDSQTETRVILETGMPLLLCSGAAYIGIFN